MNCLQCLFLQIAIETKCLSLFQKLDNNILLIIGSIAFSENVVPILETKRSKENCCLPLLFYKNFRKNSSLFKKIVILNFSPLAIHILVKF